MYNLKGTPFSYQASWDENQISLKLSVMPKATVIPRSALKGVKLVKRWAQIQVVFDYVTEKGKARTYPLVMEPMDPEWILFMNDVRKSFPFEDTISRNSRDFSDALSFPLGGTINILIQRNHLPRWGILLFWGALFFPAFFYLVLTKGYNLTLMSDAMVIRRWVSHRIPWNEVKKVEWKRLIVSQIAYGGTVGKTHWVNFEVETQEGKKRVFRADSINSCFIIRHLVAKGVLPPGELAYIAI